MPLMRPGGVGAGRVDLTRPTMASGSDGLSDGFAESAAGGMLILALILLALFAWVLARCINLIARALTQHPTNKALWICIGLLLGSLLAILGVGWMTQAGWMTQDHAQTLAGVAAGCAVGFFLLLVLVAKIVLVWGDDTLRAEQDLDIHNVLTDWWTPLHVA